MIKLLQRAFLFFFLSFGTAYAVNLPFDPNSFNQLLSQGKPVVLHFHADWCPNCRAQQAVLDDLMPLAEFKDLTVFRVNYDKEKALLRTYKVRNQSTFIIFKKGKEVARSTGETDSMLIADLLKKAL